MCYAVPLYHNGSVTGVLTATRLVRVFTDILNQSLFNNAGYTHLLDSSGNYILKADRNIIDDSIHSLLQDGFLSDTEKKSIRNAVRSSSDLFIEIKHEGKSYALNLKPLGINDWYVLCVAPVTVLEGNIAETLLLMRTVFLLVLGVLVILFAYIFQIIWKNSVAITKMAYYDPLTGAYTQSRFLLLAQKMLSPSRKYALVAVNIRKFQFINELFGSQAGDRLICHMADSFKEFIMADECYCRENADRFLLLLRAGDEETLRKRLTPLMENISNFQVQADQTYQIICSCGIKYLSEDTRHEELPAKSVLHSSH